MTHGLWRYTRIVAVACVVLSTCAVVRAQSAVDGFNPGANSDVSAVVVQADGKILIGGSFTTLGGGGTGTTTRNKLGRLNSDGSLDTSFNPGANNFVSAMAVQADGKILAGGAFTTLGGGGVGTTTRSYIGRLNANGSLDTSFNPGANNAVSTIAVQPDGKILVGGVFTAIGGGGTGTTARSRIARLNSDGSVDTSFDPGANNSGVSTIKVQRDGKILVGGYFTTLGGGGNGATARSRIGRLNSDGSLDTSFNPGASDQVYAVAVQPDGKILVAGMFGTLGGGGTGTTTRNTIGRLNADGSLDTSFNPGGTNYARDVVLQPDGKIVVVGGFPLLGGGGAGTTTRNFIGRLNADGSLDTAFNPGANNQVVSVALQADGKIVVGGAFTGLGGGTGTTTRTRIGRINADGSVDTDFNPGANNFVHAVAVQPDEKVLVGGLITGLGGGTGATTRNRIGRLNPDGSLDTSFNPGANNHVLAIAVQPDGKILLGGAFTTLGGGGTGTTTRNLLGRLNADGSLDTNFNPGANNAVFALAVQADGKILVGGTFTALGGGGTGTTPRSRIGRLNADGSLDTSFNPGVNSIVRSIVVQADGKILIGGSFTQLGGGGSGTTTRNNIGRLNADGSLDTTFNPGTTPSPPNEVHVVAVQADGKILVGGYFTGLGGGTGTTARNNVGRLHPDGSVDTSFNPGTETNASNGQTQVLAIAVQTDGKILLGGYFTGLGGGTGTTARNSVGRLNPDGSVDTSFNPGADSAVRSVVVQVDGKVLLGGQFTGLGGGTGTTTRNRIGRLSTIGTAIQSLAVVNGGGAITWSRSGVGPEVSRVTFESSTDGLTYSLLGSGARVAGGWQLAGQSLATGQNLFIRARGFSQGSVLESIRNAYVSDTAPAISVQPEGQAVATGQNATFTVAASGGPPPSYQWQLSTNGGSTFADLANGSPHSGVTSANLTITGAPVGLNGAQYRAVATNIAGTATSTAAILTVYGAASATPSVLNFAATKAGSAGELTASTAPQAVTVNFSGAASSWTASASQSWVQVSSGAGAGSGVFTVAITNPGNVIGGSPSLSATITLTAPTAPNSPVTIPVTLTVDQTGNSTGAAFGQVDTPVQGATSIVGAIGVTGWVVDDVGVSGVKIYRSCLTFENQASCQVVGGQNLVFIGDAAFVPGARPDVESAYSTYPASNVAGWGYLLLTNMLPNVTGSLGFGGQGSLNLYVFATDVEGHTTLLGRTSSDHTPTSITMSNNTIAKPFGAIDTPSQGGTVSGIFANFGWLLTPDANTTADGTDILMATNGSSIRVFIDGVSVGNVTYNQCRGNVGNPVPLGVYCNDDVANIFGNATPQPTFTTRGSNTTLFRNLDAGRAAIGSFDINTLTMANGMHSIAWGVTDTANRSEGIGSRNFFVLNTGVDQPSPLDFAGLAGQAARFAESRGGAASFDDLPRAPGQVWGRGGFDLRTPYVEVIADSAGERQVQMSDLGRVELRLEAGVTAGYLAANGVLRDLPAGSRLDVATGTFTWAPAPGYLGAYRLVFLAGSTQLPVTVTIRPLTPLAGDSEIRMNVDTPVAEQVVGRALTIAGWALDPQAFTGSGIGAVHVWARRLDVPTAGPKFVGAATLGVARPDVAAAFGAPHHAAGYQLVASLVPGRYELTVYASNQRTARWEDARTVLVTVR